MLRVSSFFERIKYRALPRLLFWNFFTKINKVVKLLKDVNFRS